MIDNSRGGQMTPEGNFAPADSSSHEMRRGSPVNPSAGKRGGEAGAGPAGLSINLQSMPEMYVIIPHNTGVVCQNEVAGIEGFLLPTGLQRFEQDTDPARGLKLVGVTLGNLVQYQAMAEQLVAKLAEMKFLELCSLSVEKMVSYLKTGLPITEKWIPFQVSDGASSPLYNPFSGKTAILVY